MTYRAWKRALYSNVRARVHNFVKNFEQVEIWKFDDVMKLGGKSAVRKAGLVKSRGKDHPVQDGDIYEFRVKNAKT